MSIYIVHDGVCVVLKQKDYCSEYSIAHAQKSQSRKNNFWSITLDLMHARDDRGNLKPRSIGHRIA